MKIRSFKNKQSGFTLIEIAIVLVIIGLLVGGVLKGQELIRNAKVKRVAKMADELRAAVMTFYDKYGVYPGDENERNIPPQDSHNGNGNGQIEWNERYYVFEDLMRANLLTGTYNGTSDLPKHAFGDNVLITWSSALRSPTNHYIFFYNLPWDVCQELDMKYDDGLYNQGSIRSSERYRESSGNIGYIMMAL